MPTRFGVQDVGLTGFCAPFEKGCDLGLERVATEVATYVDGDPIIVGRCDDVMDPLRRKISQHL
jgi:hypothetical protein